MVGAGLSRVRVRVLGAGAGSAMYVLLLLTQLWSARTIAPFAATASLASRQSVNKGAYEPNATVVVDLQLVALLRHWHQQSLTLSGLALRGRSACEHWAHAQHRERERERGRT